MVINRYQTLTLHLLLSLAVLVGTGFVAIGVSGALAAGLGAAFGKAFVSGDRPGVTYTPQRCADFLRFHPESGDCTAAATAHHFDEVVEYRLAAGVLGLLVLGIAFLMRWRYRQLADERVLPASFSPTVGASLFGLAALALMGPSLLQMVFVGPSGVGKLLSGGVVSLVMFVAYAAALLRALRAHLA